MKISKTYYARYGMVGCLLISAETAIESFRKMGIEATDLGNGKLSYVIQEEVEMPKSFHQTYLGEPAWGRNEYQLDALAIWIQYQAELYDKNLKSSWFDEQRGEYRLGAPSDRSDAIRNFNELTRFIHKVIKHNKLMLEPYQTLFAEKEKRPLTFKGIEEKYNHYISEGYYKILEGWEEFNPCISQESCSTH